MWRACPHHVPNLLTVKPSDIPCTLKMMRILQPTLSRLQCHCLQRYKRQPLPCADADGNSIVAVDYCTSVPLFALKVSGDLEIDVPRPTSRWHMRWQRTFWTQACWCGWWRYTPRSLGPCYQFYLLPFGLSSTSRAREWWGAWKDPLQSTDNQNMNDQRGQCRIQWQGERGGGG